VGDDDTAVIARLRAAGCVFAEDEARLLSQAARTPEELDEMVRRRAAGLPLEQVVGWAEFGGLRILVGPGVFVPRRRSEFLVETAVALEAARAQSAGPAPVSRPLIADVCCGTGALGLAAATRLSDAAGNAGGAGIAELDGIGLHAAEIDPDAVACARRNVEPVGGQVYEGDLFTPLPADLRGRVTTLLCNAPYVPTGQIAFLPAEAREYEHHVALDGGDDGLGILRRAAAQAPAWLAPGGHLLVETSDRQADAMSEVMAAAGLEPHVFPYEEYGSAVVTGALPR
jgi:release factor glutamine methyltransferase